MHYAIERKRSLKRLQTVQFHFCICHEDRNTVKEKQISEFAESKESLINREGVRHFCGDGYINFMIF